MKNEKTTINSDIISAIIIVLVAAIFGWQLYKAQMAQFGFIFPAFIIFSMVVCGIALFIKSVLKPEMLASFQKEYNLRLYLVAVFLFAWTFTLVNLGFGLASLIFFALIVLIAERKYTPKDILIAIVVSGLMVGVFYWIFTSMLLLRLPRGILF